jgi:hypothetical protein
MSLAHSPSIVTNGLLLALDAGNVKSYSGTGTTWSDMSGNLKTTTLTNGPVYSSSFGGMISFDGVNDYSITSNMTAPSGTNYTVSIWVRIDSSMSGVDSRFFWHGNYGVLIYKYSSNAVTIYIYNGTTAIQVVFGIMNNSDMSYGTWYNLTGTYDGSLIKTYVNGKFTNQSTQTGSIQAANTPNFFGLGANGLDTSNPTKCDISNVSIYTVTLSADEILQNFNALRGRFGI